MKWLDAANALLADPTAKVPCPECGARDLEVIDCPYGPPEEGRLERWLSCPGCRKGNSMLMRQPSASADS